MGEQVPSAMPVLDCTHAMHGVLQMVLQQTPSAQWPDWQARPSAHALPLSCGSTHSPLAHPREGIQSAEELHEVRQASPRHRYGLQSMLDGTWLQLPNTLHT